MIQTEHFTYLFKTEGMKSRSQIKEDSVSSAKYVQESVWKIKKKKKEVSYVS